MVSERKDVLRTWALVMPLYVEMKACGTGEKARYPSVPEILSFWNMNIRLPIKQYTRLRTFM